MENRKRTHDDDPGRTNPKKPRHDDRNRSNQYNSPPHPPPTNSSPSYSDALSQLPPVASKLGAVPAYTHFTVPPGLPPLPEVLDGTLSTAPFKHKSTSTYDRSTTTSDVTYERLEFLGDAQLEHIASRLIYERFNRLPAGQQSQLRELLVKNETLAEYARAYGFDKRVRVGDMERMAQDSKDRGNKGFNKVLGDVFEAYIAAVILSDAEDGFAVVEKWMTALWAPKLVEAVKSGRFYNPTLGLQQGGKVDPLKTYNPTAKNDLQTRIVVPGVKLDYERYKASVELKGAQLGENRHYIAVYVTGLGHEKRELGRGEGKNKVEAGNWAAIQAMHGEGKSLVDELDAHAKASREKRRVEREASEAAAKKKVL